MPDAGELHAEGELQATQLHRPQTAAPGCIHPLAEPLEYTACTEKKTNHRFLFRGCRTVPPPPQSAMNPATTQLSEELLEPHPQSLARVGGYGA